MSITETPDERATEFPVGPLGSIERAYADGYAAAQHEIARLRAALRAIYDEDHDEEVQPGRYADIAARALGINEQNPAIFNPDGTTIS